MDEKLPSESSNSSDIDIVSTANDYEQTREQIRLSNPRGLTSPQANVDVERAEHEFSELNRQLSTISHKTRRLSRQASRPSKAGVTTEDVEKSGSSAGSEEEWNLETALRGNRSAEAEAGIKDKHIGK